MHRCQGKLWYNCRNKDRGGEWMYYQSTRNKEVKQTATEAILKGLSKEGGLFVPDQLPKMPFTLERLVEMTYQTLAYEVMSCFFTDIEEEDLKTCIHKAYGENFDHPHIAPLKVTKKGCFLELFHGPTLAFKDMALSILPHLMITSKKAAQEAREIVILTATSGDTGKAALEGFADVEGTKIIVFFPEEGVSAIQKRQMTTQEGENTKVIGIKGNFDDAQTGVKQIFSNKALEEVLNDQGYVFSSANSINIGRLIPQVVYYFYGYSQMVKEGELELGAAMNVVVPTGNFGNILAAYYAKQMGLPIGKLICASNENKVLYDFFNTGTYDSKRAFHVTHSPSMDILISSNLERLLYHISGEDTVCISTLMEALKTKGHYTISPYMKKQLEGFYGGYANEEGTLKAIKTVYEEAQYLMDPHTAVAYDVYETYKEQTKDETPTLIVSTASPYKFTSSVVSAIDPQLAKEDDFQLIDQVEHYLGAPMPTKIKELLTKPICHTAICEVEGMEQSVRAYLKLS